MTTPAAAHTPAPWHRDKYGHVVDSQQRDIHFRSVCILSSGTPERIAEAEANTDLIAAAPDMLAALVMLTGRYGVTFQDAALRNFAVDAIRKATGSRA